MCRFLMLRARAPFDAQPVLDTFREQCRTSREYQGHGWGAAWRANGEWSRYRDLTPVWDDPLQIEGGVDFLVLHARSAFRDEGIEVANNMPFYRGEQTFVFNGELQGVKLRIPGRIGAEKIFHLVQRENRGDLGEALRRADGILVDKSRYVRAMNVALTDGDRIHASCRFNESPDYFTLHVREDDEARGVSSEPLDDRWKPMASGQQVSL